MTRPWIPVLGLALFALAAAPAALEAGAQQAQAEPQQTPEQQPGANFSGNDIESYAKAAVKVEKINQNYTEKLKAAGTPEEEKSVREEATGKMVEAIKDEGLSLEKYNAIYMAASMDPDLARRVNQEIRNTQ